MTIDTISTVLGIVAVLASGIVVWRNSTKTQAVSVWREEAEAQKARADRLEQSVQELTRRMDNLEHENATLKSLVTGHEAITDFRADAMAALGRIEDALGRNIAHR